MIILHVHFSFRNLSAGAARVWSICPPCTPIGSFPKEGDPSIDPNILYIILVIGSPKKVPLILRRPPESWRELRAPQKKPRHDRPYCRDSHQKGAPHLHSLLRVKVLGQELLDSQYWRGGSQN